jgi:hypothetical protein
MHQPWNAGQRRSVEDRHLIFSRTLAGHGPILMDCGVNGLPKGKPRQPLLGLPCDHLRSDPLRWDREDIMRALPVFSGRRNPILVEDSE